MEYLITFLEGMISFISPCMLPMLPVYIGYFAGASKNDHNEKGAALPGALSFVAGFTVVFCALGLFSGSLGKAVAQHTRIVNALCGLIVILLGLMFLEVIPMPFFKGNRHNMQIKSVFSAFVFGMVFSVSLTPCVGAFLGAALMMASSAGGAVKGVLLLFVYSMGLGIPFLLSAILIEQLKTAFDFIKRHYRTINLICGGFLILVGILMMFGLLDRLLRALSI